MNSLRSRLILGSSLIAIVPLAIAILLLSQRMGTTVRMQASARLQAALGGLGAQLEDEGRATAERVRLLARDPQLRRLYLVRPSGGAELAEFLAERRFLLGLDLLRIVDTAGVVVADGAAASLAAGGEESVPLQFPARVAPDGIAMEPIAGDTGLAMVARARIDYAGRPVGSLEGAVLLDRGYLARLSEAGGIELVLSDTTGRPVAMTHGGPREIPAGLPSPVTAGAGAERISAAGESFLARTVPLAIGPPPPAWISGFVSTAASDRAVAALQWTAALLGLLGLTLAIALAFLWSSQVSRPVERPLATSGTMTTSRCGN